MRAGAQKTGRFGLAVVVSLGGALLGGLIWAGAAAATDYEVGIMAWAVGVLAGLGVVVTTSDRSQRLGLAAAGMAVLGLLVGKLLIVPWVLAPAIEKELLAVQDIPAEILSEMTGDPDALRGIALDTLHREERMDPRVYEWLTDGDEDSEPPGDLAGKIDEAEAQAEAMIAKWSPREKDAAARRFLRSSAAELAEAITTEASLTERIGLTLSFHDIIWFFLAVGTAYKIGVGGTSED